jgi:hypothetical protein
MPTVANFVSIRDANVTIPSSDTGGLNDIHLQDIDLPGLSRGPAILFYRLRPKGRCTLQVRINGTVLAKQNLDTSPALSFHEIFFSTELKENGNELTVSVSGEGSVVVSDFVIFFQVAV